MFEEAGFTFATHNGDEPLKRNRTMTPLSRFPTLLYGVSRTSHSSVPPVPFFLLSSFFQTSIVLSTELNFNSTVNPKAQSSPSECPYTIPSPISLLLAVARSLQRPDASSAALGHSVVLAIHLNKYAPSRNHVINRNDLRHLAAKIDLPLFAIHLEAPGNTVPLSHTFDGFALRADGLNGRFASLDFVSVLLKSLRIVEFQNSRSFYFSYFRNFFAAAASRYRGIQQESIFNAIPAVALEIRSTPASLQQRTRHGQKTAVHELLHGLKLAGTMAGAVEERISRGDTFYLPLFSPVSPIPRYVHRLDLLIPAVLLILAVFCAVEGSAKLGTPGKAGLAYLGLTAGVTAFYWWLSAVLGDAHSRGEIPDGFSVFMVLVIGYSVWAYDRVVFPAMFVQRGLCSEAQCRRSIGAVAGRVTVVGCTALLLHNCELTAVIAGACVPFLLLNAVSESQSVRFAVLWVYSAAIAAPFVLMLREECREG
ncbi:uncharacterized protein [Blastocystis hominis]|uniref:Uncharacterized protein n=1 Tax=Blastocystis hominis TaxID=12968 RepID=D8M2R0_BLAHO|nr:uncharacterized protein [Blastocystis hominis]CBK22633.2 unnamed protein product [Blastocystis hominis]|eukprot:XP_012896681.1 uncharacterized protein [Blastocystis hominis]